MTRDELFAAASADGRAYLGDLADGTPVFAKKGADHLQNHRGAAELLPELFLRLSMADFTGRELSITIDLGREVGISTCVETTDADEIRFARRKGRTEGCTRFVVGHGGTPVSTMVVRLYVTDIGVVALMTAYAGTDVPAEPSSKYGRRDAATWEGACTFWRNHALCWGEPVEPEDYTSSDYFGTRPA